MTTFTDDYAALRVLATRLATVFATAPLAAKYAGYGGVDVKIITDEDSEPERVGKPTILLTQASGDGSEWSSARDEYRSVTVSATTIVSEHSGSKVGTSNPTSSDELLSKDLVAEIRDSYAIYRDAGLEGISISSQGLQKSEGDTVRRIGHSIQFNYSR